MARQKTGKPLGRPPLYSDEERPVTVSLRIPHDLAEQTKRYAALRRQSVTELLLDGLKWRIGEGDPRGVGMSLPLHLSHAEEYYSNTETSSDAPGETTATAVLEEIRTAIAYLTTQLHEIVQVITPRSNVPADNQYCNNTKNMETILPLRALAEPTTTSTQNLLEPGNVRAAHGRQPTKRTTLARRDADDIEDMPLEPETVPLFEETSAQSWQTEKSTEIHTETSEKHSDALRQTGNVPADVLDYDHTRLQLGTLCDRGHDWHGTGQSLREIRKGKLLDCRECHRERARTANARRLAKPGVVQ